jgi:hypothetical protein
MRSTLDAADKQKVFENARRVFPRINDRIKSGQVGLGGQVGQVQGLEGRAVGRSGE